MEKIGGYNLVVIDSTKKNTDTEYEKSLFKELEEKTKYGKPLHVIFDDLSECEVGYRIVENSKSKNIKIALPLDDGIMEISVSHNISGDRYLFNVSDNSPLYTSIGTEVALDNGSVDISLDTTTINNGTNIILTVRQGATYGGSKVIPNETKLRVLSMDKLRKTFNFIYGANGTIYYITMIVNEGTATFSTVVSNQ